MGARHLLIGGEAVDTDARLQVINPATGEVFSDCPRGNAGTLELAVAAAQSAYGNWAIRPIEERQGCLLELADTIEKNLEELAVLLTCEQGKPLAESRGEIQGTLAHLRHNARLEIPVEVLQDDTEALVEVHRTPLGVVAGIIPWNFPIMVALCKLAPAVLAGNSFIWKPAPTTPLTALAIGEYCKDIFPPGVINIVTDNNDLGALITRHPGIAKVSFTGSTATGKKVMESSATTLKRVTLELGGNDPAIVLPDADVTGIAPALYAAGFGNCGQTCVAMKRLYVHDSLYDAMCKEFSRLASEAVLGDGLDPKTTIGPLQNAQQLEKVAGYLQGASKTGTIIAGGTLLDGPGYFMRPTVVRDISDGDPLVDEEPFGPILPIISYTDIDDVICRANGSTYGLGASVWGTDIDQAKQVAARLQAGTKWVNQHGATLPHVPFGGIKESGIGVEYTQEGLLEFTDIQVINVLR